MSMRILVPVLVGVSALLASPTSLPAGTGAPVKTIATVTSVDYRAVLTARRGSSGTTPTAAVTVTTYTRQEGRWVLLRTLRLAETYFWRTVTGPRALCRLEMTTAAPGRGPSPRIVVRLLLSPALGCGRVHTIVLIR
ncbi:MAG TPA: hypothetical protein VFU26_12905 [Gaiellaceae bacterium]|nr:hypothetical protein [Gaiellaceae bacterium]